MIKKKLFKHIIFFAVFVISLNSKIVSSEIISIDTFQMKELMAENIPLIDVRRKDEWYSTGIITNSHLHTFFDKNGNYNFPNFVEKISKIENVYEGIILFCRTGRRTTIIANALEKTGKYKKIYNTKGITEWVYKNHKLSKYIEE